MPTDTAIGKNINMVAVALLIAYMLWIAVSVSNNDKRIAVIETRLENTDKISAEVVPRAENERRYESLEKGQSQNAERIGRLEQYIYNKNNK